MVIFNRVNVKRSFSLLRKRFFFRLSALKGSSEMRRLLGKDFKWRQTLAPVQESDKKALILAQNSL